MVGHLRYFVKYHHISMKMCSFVPLLLDPLPGFVHTDAKSEFFQMNSPRWVLEIIYFGKKHSQDQSKSAAVTFFDF